MRWAIRYWLSSSVDAPGYSSCSRSNSDSCRSFSARTTGGNCLSSPTSTNRSARVSAASVPGSVNWPASSTTATSNDCVCIVREPHEAVVAATTGASCNASAQADG